jgi:hypothetical protein
LELRDLIVTPIIIIIVYMVGYFIRPMLTNQDIRKYYFPALTVKIIGALAVGFIYQFYYGGGDTFNYHTQGSRIIWKVLTENLSDGMKLFFNSSDPDLYVFTSRIPFYHDPSSFFVIRIATLLDLLTFSAYSGTAVLFAFLSFLGMWYFFLSFYELFPKMHRWFAFSAFFIPSVFFWGSGILKDTILMTCLGLATYLIKKIFIDKNFKIISVILLIVSLTMMFGIKKYVLLCFIPASLFWIYAGNLSRVKSGMLRLLLLPFILIITVFTGFYAIQKVGEGDPRYALNQIAKTAQITAYDIGFYTGKNAGSGYSLGELDGSFTGMLRLAPQAVNVTLFRPYPWEAKTFFMLLSSLEALLLGLFTLYLFFTKPISFFRSLSDPTVLFCFVFSITFAFAVGVSTYNFGTLVRYKIPMLPFFVVGLVLVANQINKERKFASLAETE